MAVGMIDNNENVRDIEAVILAPESCCFLKNPELGVFFFNKAAAAFKNNKSVTFDMSEATEIDEAFGAILVAHIKDRNVSLGLSTKIIFPIEENCTKKLKEFGVFKKVSNSGNDFVLDERKAQKITSSQVANRVASNIVDKSSFFIYGKKRKIKELYALLIELMANTNNHASRRKRAEYQWWLFAFIDYENNRVKFVFLDLGIGIFESLPVRQYIKENPYSVILEALGIFRHGRGKELARIFSALVAGKIKSSTGDPSRGKGIPLMSDSARSGHFETFYTVSNDAFVDVISGKVSSMSQSFQGTLFSFELREYKANDSEN